MDVRQHEWLPAPPHDGFEQMRLKSRPRETSPSLARAGANFYGGVKQQDYSASVWLRRKDKLEHVRALARSPGLAGPAPARTRLLFLPAEAGVRWALEGEALGLGGAHRGLVYSPSSNLNPSKGPGCKKRRQDRAGYLDKARGSPPLPSLGGALSTGY